MEATLTHPIDCTMPVCIYREKAFGKAAAEQDFWDFWREKGIRRPNRYRDLTFVETYRHEFEKMCPVVRRLVPNYDIGIGIATGAMALYYMLDRHGLPMLIVKQHADHSKKDGEATWEPVDEIDEGTLGGKRIVVAELDILTGKTVAKAAKELRRCKPQKLDLLLRYGPIRNVHWRDEENGMDMRKRIPYGPEGFDEVLFFGELRQKQS